MKTSAILTLIASALWISGFVIASVAQGHAGISAILFTLCIFTGLIIGAVAALIFLYRLIEFLITKDPRSLQ